MDTNSVTGLVTDMIKRTMGVDICEIIPAYDFKKIDMEDTGQFEGPDDPEFVHWGKRSGPLRSGNSRWETVCADLLGKNRPEAGPFDKREVQLAVGISHQTALAMQRIELLEKIRREGKVKQLLLRFISPMEAEGALKDC